MILANFGVNPQNRTLITNCFEEIRSSSGMGVAFQQAASSLGLSVSTAKADYDKARKAVPGLALETFLNDRESIKQTPTLTSGLSFTSSLRHVTLTSLTGYVGRQTVLKQAVNGFVIAYKNANTYKSYPSCICMQQVVDYKDPGQPTHC